MFSFAVFEWLIILPTFCFRSPDKSSRFKSRLLKRLVDPEATESSSDDDDMNEKPSTSKCPPTRYLIACAKSRCVAYRGCMYMCKSDADLFSSWNDLLIFVSAREHHCFVFIQLAWKSVWLIAELFSWRMRLLLKLNTSSRRLQVVLSVLISGKLGSFF